MDKVSLIVDPVYSHTIDVVGYRQEAKPSDKIICNVSTLL